MEEIVKAILKKLFLNTVISIPQTIQASLRSYGIDVLVTGVDENHITTDMTPTSKPDVVVTVTFYLNNGVVKDIVL